MDGGKDSASLGIKRTTLENVVLLHVWNLSHTRYVNYKIYTIHRSPVGARINVIYLSKRIKFFRVAEFMDVYCGKVSGKSLVAAELAFSDGDEEVNNCAFTEFINA